EEESRKVPKGKLIFGRGEKYNPEDIFQRLKDESAGVLDELQRILGEDFRASVHLAKEHVSKSRDWDSLFAQKTYILSVIDSFVQRSVREKDQATSFLKEVGERLLNMEKDMLSSSLANEEVHLESSRFNVNLEAEVADFRENVLTSTDFENLRTFVVAQLTKISSVLQKRGQEYVVHMERAQQESENMKKNFRTLIGQVIDKNKTLLEEIQRDPLTEILNRRTYEISLAAEFDRYIRYRKPFSLVFFDVDHFKNVNDRYGHEAGDRVLRAISRKVRDILRKPDIFARYGGEEFVVILPETNLDSGISAAKKIRELVEETVFEYEGNRVPITISLGVTGVNSGDTDPTQITLRADKHLYRAKTEGRNRMVSDYDVK
ncbi:MAG: GGDEF domain-containing protein, partial [Candidatus Latescibacterota bacterium]